MYIFHKIETLRKHLDTYRGQGTIGLVPTMGALHQGHLKLVEEALKTTDLVVTTIFVNPTQFNNREDLKKYPRDTAKDLELLEDKGNHIVFIPEEKEIYPTRNELKIDFGPIERSLEGAFREGHFSGVGLVVSKLFNIVQPNVAFFGQKDLQQFFVIKTLVEQLNFPIELHRVPTIREKSGLAMSSRNLRLNETELDHAALLYRSLTMAKELLLGKETTAKATQKVALLFEATDKLALEYFEVVDTSTFEPLEWVSNPETTALCIAAHIDNIRLIDNLLLIS